MVNIGVFERAHSLFRLSLNIEPFLERWMMQSWDFQSPSNA